jgi:PKD repeat protein
VKQSFHFQTEKLFGLSALKLLLISVLLVLMLGSQPVYSTDDVYLSFANGEKKNFESTLPKLTVTDLGTAGVEIQYTFNGVVLSPVEAGGTTYYMPHIYGFSHLDEVGAPRLPAKNHHIALPYGSKAVVEIVDSAVKEYPDSYLIHPALQLAADCKDCPDPKFEIDRELYGTDAGFPANPVQVVETETFRGVQVAVIQVRPLQFNPVTGKLTAYTRLAFKVTYSGGERSFDRYSNANTDAANQMVKNVVLNRSALPKGVDRNKDFNKTRGDRKDYIMIVHSDYLTAAETLANWKRQMGYSVEIVSQSSWTTTQVNDALQTRYDSWSPKPLYFLIFGDQEDIPSEYTGARYTDLYYAEMEGTGYKPEMAYGRIFASSAAEAQVIVDKIINYEKTPPTLSSFYTNALACAYYQDSDLNSYADRRFSHTSEDLRTYVMGQGYGVDRVYVTGGSVDPLYYNDGYYSPSGTPVPAELRKPGFPWDGDATDITNFIDAGRFLVWHRDHGDVTLWGDPYYTTTNIGQLNNGELLPVVCSVNCLTGQFVYATECFAERFLRRSGGGCVGIFAATELSYSGPNDGYAPGIIDAIWPDPGIDPQYGSGGLGNPIPAHDPIYTMGDVLNHSKNAMEYLWGLHQTTWELHHYFGDPAMQLWTAVPTTATASHDLSIPPGGTSLAITASNCPGGIATLVYEDVLIGKTVLAGDGTGTITFASPGGGSPLALLTISKHNYKPYVANISVSPVPPAADFSADSTTVMATGSVQFTDLSTNGPTSWDWTFSGGTPGTSTEQNPVVTYNTPCTYTVTLIAANPAGSDTETKTGYITVTVLQPPAADFSASSTNISAGDSVTFTDLSTNNPNSWSWTFDGGTPGTSTGQNPTVTYNTPGTYSVTLLASNGAGSDSETKTGYITVAEKPYCASQGNTYSMEWIERVVVDTLDNTSGAAGYTDFTSITTNLTAGDTVNVSLTPGFSGTTYTEYWKIWIDYNGDHDFEDAGEEVFSGYGSSIVSGNFTVASGVDIVTRMRVSMKYASYQTPCETFTYGEVEDYTVDIGPGTGQPPAADFSATATAIFEGDSVTFTDLSTNSPNAWDWTFSGGTPATSTVQNPTVTYNTAGTYDVTLVATNAYGNDTETKVGYITVQPVGSCIGVITNAGFETGTTSGWTETGSVSIATEAHSGTYSVSLDGAGSSVEQVITGLCPNTSYTLYCWGKAKEAAGVSLGVKNYGGAEQTVPVLDHRSFLQYSITFTTGSTDTSATIFASKSGSKFGGNMDDFELVKN